MSGAVRCWGVLPAAGIGSRMGGDVPKQYLELALTVTPDVSVSLDLALGGRLLGTSRGLLYSDAQSNTATPFFLVTTTK